MVYTSTLHLLVRWLLGGSKEDLYAESSNKMNHVVETIQVCCRKGSLRSSLQILTVITGGGVVTFASNAWDIEAVVEDKSSVLSRTCFLAIAFLLLACLDLWHRILAAILVAHATMKYSNSAWKPRFLRTFALRHIVVFLPTGIFLSLSTKDEWARRASGTHCCLRWSGWKLNGQNWEEDWHNHEKKWEKMKTLCFHA